MMSMKRRETDPNLMRSISSSPSRQLILRTMIIELGMLLALTYLITQNFLFFSTEQANYRRPH